MSQLNSKPEISKDRLRRVQTRADTHHEPPETPDIGPAIARHHDVALLVKQEAKYTYIIGRVLRIRNKGSKGRIEYNRPVYLSEREKFENVRLLVKEYTPQRRNFVYNKSLSLSHTKEYSIKAVIMPVSMNYTEMSQLYSLEPTDKSQLNQFVSDKNKVRTKPTKQKQMHNVSQYMEDDGVRRQRITVPGKRTRIMKTFYS